MGSQLGSCEKDAVQLNMAELGLQSTSRNSCIAKCVVVRTMVVCMLVAITKWRILHDALRR